MFRPASRALLRAPAPAVNVARGPSRRFISSSASGPSKPRSWKNTFVRVGLAVGAVYYYNTSSVFAETPSLSFRNKPQPQSDNENPLPTLDSVKPKSREEKKAPAPAPAPSSAPAPASTDASAQPESESPLKSAEELEAEADQQAAFNPETGEINWDCPCLGGMAYGPCGEEFRAAFSCFVYSEEEPKGMDCIDKFKGMQDCFRAHPEHYGAELEDDEEASAASSEQPLTTEVDASVSPASQGAIAETEEVVPKVWHESEAEKKPEQQTEK
ncbi:hypothetical protein BDW74DRAFT_153188 [Aspergillus multicolor]|uniref:coiled-coil-helix-coiled-coil-helix domain-containing protein n=1 Tax=Aspergillus multicolor TaxID=41759 RepID=UPI003CCDFB87